MNRIGKNVVAFLDIETVELQARQQIDNIAAMPFVKGLAVMPDCHFGRGATVGSVIATDAAIIPAAVGVDIGCGMIAVRTPMFAKDLPEDLTKLLKSLERAIPVSAGVYNTQMTDTAMERCRLLMETSKDVDYAKFSRNWNEQLGTLGGGNHFIEISLDEEDRVWAVLHSGSRGVGNQIAQAHIKTALNMCNDMFVNLADPDLAYLPQNSPQFSEYIRDLHWAQEFARMSRDEMMDRVMRELSFVFYGEPGHEKALEVKRINCHHNFTQCEHHMGRNLWITRKGAIQMRNGQEGVIPGSMGTRSYIVEGLENEASFHSAPHGAGRNFSRNEARKRFTMEDFDRDMKGIMCRRDEKFIDELPGAYKNIDTVMENSKELVKVKHVLRQVLNLKGE